MSFLRLPRPVDAVFVDRLQSALPLRAPRVLARFCEMTAAAPDPYARTVEAVFAATCRRLALPFWCAGDDRANTPSAGPLDARTFRRPPRAGDQTDLFR